MTIYSPEQQKESGLYGTKKFFMLCYHDAGQVDDDVAKIQDYAWLEREEVVNRIKEQDGEDMSKLYHYMLQT